MKVDDVRRVLNRYLGGRKTCRVFVRWYYCSSINSHWWADVATEKLLGSIGLAIAEYTGLREKGADEVWLRKRLRELTA